MNMSYQLFENKWEDEEMQALEELGEFFAAGFLRQTGFPIIMRMAYAILNQLKKGPLPVYSGTRLYPSGDCSIWNNRNNGKSPLVTYCANGFWFNMDEINKRIDITEGSTRSALLKLKQWGINYPHYRGSNHNNPNFKRILAEGLGNYKNRILTNRSCLNSNDEKDEKVILYKALEITIEGIEIYLQRICKYLDGISFSDDHKEINRKEIINCFKVVPVNPAQSFFHAMAAVNFLFYLDETDNIGRFDQIIYPYHCKSLVKNEISTECELAWIREFWHNIDETDSWNVTIGGSYPNGKNASNELTILCIEAAKGRRRPNLSLLVNENMPDTVWDKAFECLLGGNGIPAFYGEKNIIAALENAKLGLSSNELHNIAFAGCTETYIDGSSNVGCIDAHFNTLLVLEQCIYDYLPGAESFQNFYDNFNERILVELRKTMKSVCQGEKINAEYYPQLFRTLTTDDCIDCGVEYNSGGAKWNWSLISIDALSNSVDSLYAIRESIFDKKQLTVDSLIYALKTDYSDKEVREYLKELPKFGNGIAEIDIFASELSSRIFNELLENKTWRGGKFIASVNLFSTYADLGKQVGATPDGRKAYEPIADSAGAMQGNDRNGPTSLLRSVVNLDYKNAAGTLVVNLWFTSEIIEQSKKAIKYLIETFFDMGGNQLQINTVSQKILEDAIKHPDQHQNLIVRVAGYSEYFNRLDKDLKLAILQRTAHKI